MPTSVGLVLILALVLANGFFVATEFAIVAVRRSRLEDLAAEGNVRAEAALDITKHLDIYIAACQLGITMASLALGWVGEPALAHLIEPLTGRVVGPWAPAMAHGVSIAIAFSFITALHIVVGELAPKGLALQKTEGVALWVAGPIKLFYFVFRWPTTWLNAVGNGLLKLFGMRPAGEQEMAHSVGELQVLVKSMERLGVFDAGQARIASRAFEFGDVAVAALMTPRLQIEAIPVTADVDTLLDNMAAGVHARLPVYEGTLDNIVGILHVRDLISAVHHPAPQFNLRSILRPVLAIPKVMPAHRLLERMRDERRQIAVVVDEYGGTAGIVAIEDLAAAVLGKIASEVHPGSPLETRHTVRRDSDGSLLLEGLTRLGELEEMTGIRLREGETSAETLGGLVMEQLGRIPKVGDAVEVWGHSLRVEQLAGLRAALVRVAPMRKTGNPA